MTTSSLDWGSLVAGGLGALLGSSGGYQQSGVTTNTAGPWQPQQPYLLDLFSRAMTQSQQPATSAAMDSAFAGMQGAINPALTNQASGVISNTLGMDPSQYYGIGRVNPYQGQTTAPVTNPYLGMDNPYLKQSVDAASQSAMRNMMPAFNQAQRASGSFGNSGIAETFGRTAAETLGNISNNAYMNQFNTQQGLAQNLGLANAQLQQGDITRNANLAQTGIANDIGQYNTGMGVLSNTAFNAPNFSTSSMNPYGTLYNAATLQNNAQWNPLLNYSSMIRGSYGGSTSTPYYTNPYAGALGGAVAGSQLYNSIVG